MGMAFRHGASTAALEAVSLEHQSPEWDVAILGSTDRKVSVEWESLLSSSESDFCGDADRECQIDVLVEKHVEITCQS